MPLNLGFGDPAVLSGGTLSLIMTSAVAAVRPSRKEDPTRASQLVHADPLRSLIDCGPWRSFRPRMIVGGASRFIIRNG
jgi:hypothetical protein